MNRGMPMNRRHARVAAATAAALILGGALSASVAGASSPAQRTAPSDYYAYVDGTVRHLAGMSTGVNRPITAFVQPDGTVHAARGSSWKADPGSISYWSEAGTGRWRKTVFGPRRFGRDTYDVGTQRTRDGRTVVTVIRACRTTYVVTAGAEHFGAPIVHTLFPTKHSGPCSAATNKPQNTKFVVLPKLQTVVAESVGRVRATTVGFHGYATPFEYLPGSKGVVVKGMSTNANSGTVFLVGQVHGTDSFELWTLQPGTGWTGPESVPLGSGSEYAFASMASAWGRLVVGFHNPLDGTVSVATRDRHGTWTAAQQLPGSPTGASFLRLAPDAPRNAIVAAYSVEGRTADGGYVGGIALQRFNAGTWSAPSYLTSTFGDRLHALALTPDGSPVLVFERS